MWWIIWLAMLCGFLLDLAVGVGFERDARVPR